MSKVFYRCMSCGQIVFRIPGHRHGDGQIDTDDNPVYLLGSAEMVEDAGPGICVQRIENCGCDTDQADEERAARK
jgi:hypothetical protein